MIGCAAAGRDRNRAAQSGTIERSWPAVEAVADALAAHQVLPPSEARALCWEGAQIVNRPPDVAAIPLKCAIPLAGAIPSRRLRDSCAAHEA
jgi:hypothetical protein